MKIPTISFSAQNNRFNAKIETNQHKRINMLNFNGNLNPEKIKKFPLEKKLTYMFDNCNIGDIIAVGKTFEEVYKGLSNVIGDFSDIIKRIFFIKHGGISSPILFDIFEGDSWGCTNLGDKKILVATEDEINDLEASDGCTIFDGDVIINNKITIPIQTFSDYSDAKEDHDDLMLLTNPENFATNIYNLDEIQEKKIQKANIEALKSLKDTTSATEEDRHKKLSFKDVGGLDKTIDNLKKSILYPIKFPFAYENVALNHGILLHGKPGTGKTLLAEALANESNAKFFKLCGTDFESKWVGDTEEKWRDLFKDAIEQQPSIIFIDEFDAVVKERGMSESNSHSDKTVNQILSLMSDLEKSDNNVFVIATTNKLDTIDKALLRSGRFGKQIEVTAPDKEGLRAIYRIHTRDKNMEQDINEEYYMNEFKNRNFTGADIKHIVNEAHTTSWLRTGIYKKMEENTLTPKNIESVYINSEDLNIALKDWDSSHNASTRKAIGYN